MRIIQLVCWVLRRHQRFPARWRLVEWVDKHRSQLGLIASGPKSFGHGISLYIATDDVYDGQKYLVHGLNLREPLANLLSQILRKGDTMLDIGANVGYFAAMASLLVGAEGSVYAFEANEETYGRLTTLLADHDNRNIRGFHFAVANICGTLSFHCGPTHHTGISSLRRLHEDERDAVVVPAITIDSMMSTIGTVRLATIDVEGAEALVLEGMQAIIARDEPYLLVELTDTFLRSLGSDKWTLVELMEGKGYRVLRIGRTVLPYAHVDECQCDVLFVPPGAPAFDFDERRVDLARYL